MGTPIHDHIADTTRRILQLHGKTGLEELSMEGWTLAQHEHARRWAYGLASRPTWLPGSVQ